MNTTLQLALVLLVVSSDACAKTFAIYLARDLPTRHVNAFHTVSRKTFDAAVARLHAAIPSLKGDEVLV